MMDLIKHDVVHYWARRADDFEKQRMREMRSAKRERWLHEIRRYLPGKAPERGIPGNGKLRVLDLGTGTGFFAFLMAEEGHEVTGIDLTPEMIGGARHTAQLLGQDVRFEVMDAERPRFAPESFDVLLTRNLTWTLPHMERAYRSWYELLSPGGVLINFDADYCRAADEDEAQELPENHAHKMLSEEMRQESDSIMMELSAYQLARPQWDVQLMVEAGFERISVDMGVYRRIYREIDEFYNPTPIFALAAYKTV